MGTKKLAYINPNMLKWARSETPFTSIDDVIIRRPKYKHEQIESWENGDSHPSITEAKDLASLYDVPFACLYFTNIPNKKVRPYTDRRMVNNITQNEISYNLWKEIRKIMTNREISINVKRFKRKF